MEAGEEKLPLLLPASSLRGPVVIRCGSNRELTERGKTFSGDRLALEKLWLLWFGSSSLCTWMVKEEGRRWRLDIRLGADFCRIKQVPSEPELAFPSMSSELWTSTDTEGSRETREFIRGFSPTLRFRSVEPLG